jgi:hypothetical protein
MACIWGIFMYISLANKGPTSTGRADLNNVYKRLLEDINKLFRPKNRVSNSIY